MSRDSFKTWAFGVFTLFICGGTAWALTEAVSTGNRCTKTETRLDAQATDISDIKASVKETQSDVKEILRRVK